jgi:hypothetical protein
LHAGTFIAVANAQEKDNNQGGEKKCKTALDLIASQNTNLPLHPVFQNILNSKDLKGTVFIPTTKAWDKFFATMRQRQGNPAAPAMVTRYGQILLYHLAKVRGQQAGSLPSSSQQPAAATVSAAAAAAETSLRSAQHGAACQRMYVAMHNLCGLRLLTCVCVPSAPQDVNVPIAEATPGANKFAVDTASTLQCTFGPGLPNNRLVIRKTPVAIIVSAGRSPSASWTFVLCNPAQAVSEVLQLEAAQPPRHPPVCAQANGFLLSTPPPDRVSCHLLSLPVLLRAPTGPARNRQCHHHEPEDQLLWW